MTNRTDQLLDIIEGFAQAQQAAEDLGQTGSMDAAAALEALRAQGDWVAEWEAEKPKGPKASNAWRADSRSRFAQWLKWKQEQTGRHGLHYSRTYQLLNAAEISNFDQVEIRTERAARPLYWLIRNGYPDRIPEVWNRARLLAPDGQPDATNVRQALAQWKKEALGPKGVTRAVRTSRAKRRRLKLMAELRVLAFDDPAEFNQLIDDLEGFMAKVNGDAA